MLVLLRLLLGLMVLYFICQLFYKMGRKSMMTEEKPFEQHNRKKVDSTVVEKKEE